MGKIEIEFDDFCKLVLKASQAEAGQLSKEIKEAHLDVEAAAEAERAVAEFEAAVNSMKLATGMDLLDLDK